MSLNVLSLVFLKMSRFVNLKPVNALNKLKIIFNKKKKEKPGSIDTAAEFRKGYPPPSSSFKDEAATLVPISNGYKILVLLSRRYKRPRDIPKEVTRFEIYETYRRFTSRTGLIIKMFGLPCLYIIGKIIYNKYDYENIELLEEEQDEEERIYRERILKADSNYVFPEKLDPRWIKKIN